MRRVIVVIMASIVGCATRGPLTAPAVKVEQEAQELAKAASPWPDLKLLVADVEASAARLVEASKAMDARTDAQVVQSGIVESEPEPEPEPESSNPVEERYQAQEDLYEAIRRIEEWLDDPELDPILITPFGIDVMRERVRALQQRLEESR